MFGIIGGLEYGNWPANSSIYGGALASSLAGLQSQTLFAQQLAAQQNTNFTPTPSSPLKNAGIEVGELIGWRIWRLDRTTGLLRSFSASYVWLPGFPAQGKPGDYDFAGIWAFKDPNLAACKLVETGFDGVLGSVALWGEIVEHTMGYRAEFAEVRSILMAPTDRLWWRGKRRWLPILQKTYGVEPSNAD